MMAELRKRKRGHARPLKHLDERFEWYAQAIEDEPENRRGRWAERLEGAREVHLDLGCGKGQFTVAEALAHQDVLYVGLDCEKPCIALAAQRAIEQGCDNAVFVLADGEDVREFFGPGELSRIYLNFPTPHPRKKHAYERLTYVDQLVAYRELLSSDGMVSLRTDSAPFFEFSLIQFELAAYDIVWRSEDMFAELGGEPVSEYEQRLTAKGAKVHACDVRVADRPISTEQTAELSLFEYLPEDLSELDYVPYGMEGYVLNMTSKRAKDFARAQTAQGLSERGAGE